MNDLQNNIETRSMLPVGTILQGGKYRIERYLSSGGFGNTYVATNTEFEEQVAIKEFFMRGISQRDGDSVTVSVSNETNVSQFVSQKEKFRKEARRLRKLHNNHIVSVHDLFEENGTAYYEMDLIKGESLSERMKRTGTPLSEAEVLAVLDQVLDALAVVHAQGLYHLDLKPANIMMDEKGRALLIDFGASKQMSAKDGYSISTSTSLSFTPGFAPLEQTEQNMKAFGPWTDLYALGATLYKLLTGLTPPSASELLVSREPLVFPTPVSPRMQQLIAWMMKPAYVDRPQSVAEVKCYMEGNSINEETVMVFSQKSLHDQTQSINIPPQQPENKEVIPNEIREFDAKQSITNISEPNGISKNNSKGWIIGFLAIAIFTFIVVIYNVSNTTQSSPVIISDDSTTTEEISQDVIPAAATTTWDDDAKTGSFADLLDKATWVKTEYGFKFPNCMTPSNEIWVEDVPASLYRWNYEDVCLACWPLLGTWAVMEYPETGSYLTEDVHVKNITYQNSNGTVFSGYTTDGRIWYMKKKLTEGGEVVHAKILVLIYPKAMQGEEKRLIDVVKGW